MAHPGSALAELEERLKANGVQSDPSKIASAILGLARINCWNERPEQLIEWMERLALDVGHSWSQKYSEKPSA
jgi:hypothetical protein